MAASTREVFLLLRARDEASRVLRGFSSELTRSSNLVAAAAMRSRATELQREVALRRQEAAILANASAEKLAAAAVQAKRIADSRSMGVSSQRISSMIEVERRLKAEAAETNNRIRVMDKETSAMVAEIRMLDRESSELERSHRLQRQLGQAISATGAAAATLGVAFIGAAAVTSYFFVQSFKSFQEYQRQVALTRTQIDGFTASFDDVSRIGLKIANDIPVAFGEIQPALFDIFSSTNANLKQSQILLEGFSKAAVAGQTDIQTAARGTLAIMNGLNVPFEDVNHILDVQFELVRKGVGTYEEFAKVFGRIIPAANRSQQSFETVAAMLAFMTRNGQSAAQAATAAARALELFTHPTAVKSLEKMNVKVQDLKGNYLPLIDILKQLREQLLKIPQSERVATLVDMFKGAGFNIQARRFLEQVVLGQGELENFADLLKSMGSAAGVMGSKYADMADTAASKTQLLANRWETLKIAMGEAVAPVMLKVMELFSRLLQWFNELDPATKKSITNFLLVATALSFVGGAALVFLGVLAGVVAAVVAAGATLGVIIGLVVALGAAFIALSVGIGIAWKESENFRAFVMGTIGNVRDLWTEIKTLGDRMHDAFKEHGAPALERLQEVIETKVLPALNTFRKEFIDVVMPKVVEALRIIGDFSEHVLKNIGKIINDYVAPALAMLSEWWSKNQEQIMPFIAAAAEMLKWLLIIAAAIVGSGLLGGLLGLVSAISLVVGAFVVAIESFKLVKRLLKDFIDYLGDATDKTGKRISKIWDSVWSFVKAVFQAGLDFIKAEIALAIGILSFIWESFWAAFGGPIKAAFELVDAIVGLGVQLLLLPIRLALQGLKITWDATWYYIGGPVKAAWDFITGATKSGTDATVGWFTKVTSYITQLWEFVWNWVYTRVKFAWDLVNSIIIGAVATVVSTLVGWHHQVVDTISGIVSKVRLFISNLATEMVILGAKLISSLIDGITSKIESLTKKIKEITQKIKDFFPSSPAKTGPLSGKGSPFKSGQAISDMLAAGMLYQTDSVRSATMQLAAATIPSADFAGPNVLAPVGLGGSDGSPFTPVRSNNVTVNVYTNEIDPRIHATELGWELEARL